MDAQLQSWQEKLNAIEIGKPREMLDTESKSSVYTCIREHFPKGSGKKFAVRTHPDTQKRFIIRIK